MSLSAILDGVGTAGLNLGQGRRPKQIAARVKRELTEEDLLVVATQEAGIKPVPLQGLKQSHHTIAKLLAKGETQQNVSVICGISGNRISILCGDPAFAELVAYYTDMEDAAHEQAVVDIANRLALLGEDSVEALHDRLRDNPDQFANKELIALAEGILDRIGFGKTSTVNNNVNLGVSDETLARLRNASDAPAQLTEEDRGALLGLVVRATDVHPKGEAADGEPGGWSSLREEGGPSNSAGVPVGEISPVGAVSRQEGERLLRAGDLDRAPEGGDPAGGEADGRALREDADGVAVQAAAGEDHF